MLKPAFWLWLSQLCMNLCYQWHGCVINTSPWFSTPIPAKIFKKTWSSVQWTSSRGSLSKMKSIFPPIRRAFSLIFSCHCGWSLSSGASYLFFSYRPAPLEETPGLLEYPSVGNEWNQCSKMPCLCSVQDLPCVQILISPPCIKTRWGNSIQHGVSWRSLQRRIKILF